MRDCKKNIVVVCQTPLHFLFALTVIGNKRNLESVKIVWIKESDIGFDFIKWVVELLGASLFCLKDNRKMGGRQIIGRYINLRIIKNEGCLHKFDDLYIFNDLAPEVQYLAKIAMTNGARVNLIEDGVAIYDVGGRFDVKWYKVLLGKFFYGFWWRKPSRIGGLLLHQRIYAVRPDMVRKDIVFGVQLSRIPPPPAWGYDFFGVSKLDSGSVILLIPFLGGEGGARSFVNIMRRDLSCHFGRLYLKFHPQDKSYLIEFVLNELRLSNLFVLRSDLPAEVYLSRDSHDVTVVGFMTSSLHIINNLFLPSCAKYISVGLSDDWHAFYKNMGVVEYKVFSHAV